MQFPPEIWLQIFFWATYSPVRLEFEDVKPKPFIDEAELKLEQLAVDALKTKCKISLVCRQWKAFVTQYLYEDIKINRHCESLAEVVERPSNADTDFVVQLAGHYVRRVVIDCDVDMPKCAFQKNVTRIVTLCPNLLILSNTLSPLRQVTEMIYGFKFPFSPDLTDIPSLRCLHLFTIGRTSLPSFLQSASNLEVISLSGYLCLSSHFPNCPNLQTIILKKDLYHYFFQGYNYTCEVDVLHSLNSCSSIRRIILDLPFSVVDQWLLDSGGSISIHNIESVELLLRSSFVWADSSIRRIIRDAQYIRRWYFGLFYTAIINRSDPDFRHEYLEHIGIHGQRSEEAFENYEWGIERLSGHFANFNKDIFPSLKIVTMHGNWTDFVEDARFLTSLNDVRSRGIKLYCEDPSLVGFLVEKEPQAVT